MQDGLTSIIEKGVDFFLLTVPILLPIFLIWVLYRNYVNYAQEKKFYSFDYIVLEIKPPAEVKKSPAAMELFLVALHQTSGETTWVKRTFQGGFRAWFSLEIVSKGGNIHFYIWTRSVYKRFIESQLYAQYPGAEVNEVEDYSQSFDFNPEKNELFGIEYKLTKPDPYPIKTYVDYALDQGDKEEEQVDPITPMMEYMGSLRPGEQMWVQFIVRAHRAQDKVPGKLFAKTDLWQDVAKEEVQKIREESLSKDDKGGSFTVNQTEGQKKRIAAIERSVAKLGFDVGIRALYMADQENFDGINIPLTIAMLKQFNSNDLNGFGPYHLTVFDYPWDDFFGIRGKKRKYEILEQYKGRGYFFTSRPKGWFSYEDRSSFILNTEELATMYHLPGQVAQTPTIGRVESQRAAPPPNLPIQ
ncbi:hypothetical protein H6775_02005 [Candidatus Nomurabacteria bacterium]|nr:hypothetical protein [Candidatus Nomurabacteria bacterium]